MFVPLLIFVGFLCGPALAADDLPKVLAPVGEVVGSWMETRKGRRFEAYRGIRYAESPTEELRFKPPRPIFDFDGPFNASAEGPACPTYAADAEYYYPNFSEDCLRLNVYTPGRNYSGGRLPVIVYIHSGGFYSMSGRSDLAGPHYLLDRDIVLVTMNYRLESFGFLSTGDALAPGNNGMLDQATAIQWVQRNVAAFGGDPALVTLAGCSAGSISVMLHMISPLTRGTFHRAISISASPFSKERTPHDLKALAFQQADIMKCPKHSTQAIIDCLKTKTWRELGDSLIDFYTFGFDPLTLWLPHVENDFNQTRFLPEEPRDAVKGGRYSPVPHLVTTTRLEFYWKAFTVMNNATLMKQMNEQWDSIAPVSFALPINENTTHATQTLKQKYLNGKELANDTASLEGLAKLYADALIGFNVHRMANLMCRRSPQPLYYGLFNYTGDHSHYEDPTTGKPIGPMHHDDLIYLFSLLYRFPLISTDSPHSHFVDFMTALWYQFAKYGDMTPRGDIPELASLHWPAMTPSDRRFLTLDDSRKVETNLFEDRFSTWDELYPMDY